MVVFRTVPRAVEEVLREPRREVSTGRVLELCFICGSLAGVAGALQWNGESRESPGSVRGPRMQGIWATGRM